MVLGPHNLANRKWPVKFDSVAGVAVTMPVDCAATFGLHNYCIIKGVSGGSDMLKLVYSFFLGLLLVIFVGFGVATFYTSPKAPEYPTVLQTAKSPDAFTAEQSRADAKYQADSKAYNKRFEAYNRNVAMIVLGAAVVLVVLGLVLHPKTDVIADGLLLGGTFSLLYSIGRSFAGQDPKYSFMVVTIGLIITMTVGYMKFIKAPSALAKGRR